MITSVNNPRVVEWSKLKRTKFQKEYKQFIIEEKILIEEALNADLSFITIARIDSGLDADFLVSDHVMEKISQNKSLNDIVAVVDFYDHQEELGKKVVYLDNLQDPGNVGTIIRTAYALGYNTIVTNGGVSRYNHKLISASKGAVFHMNIIENINLLRLKSEGYQIIGTQLDQSALRLEDVDVSDKVLIAFGNEGTGLSDEVVSLLDQSIYIEMNRFDSLNVAVAAGIVLYTLR